MFKKNLYTYSFIKTLYDQKRDYLVAFSPLIYDGIPTDTCVPIEQIQTAVEEKRGLKFPLHIMKTVLTRGKRDGLVTSPEGKNLFCLTEKGVKLVDEIEDSADVERRINALGEDLVRYFAEKKVEKSEEQVSAILQKFIDVNLVYLIDLFGNGADSKNIEVTRKDELFLLGYIKEAMKSKPAHFSTLKELIYGSIIASLVYVRSTKELTELGGMGFKSAKVYLDTNIVFSALGFHTPEMTQSTVELLDLIKEAGLDLWVYEFTVDEMCGIFKVYSKEGYKYPKSLGIDSILSTFKQQGLGVSDMTEMTGNIESLLSNLGIRVDPTPEVNLRDYESSNENIRGRVGANKSNKSLSNINHDLAAIDHIREYRGRSVRKIEEPKAIFLTADKSLHNVCARSFDHVANATLPETILDRLFANILWLKNPDLNLPIELMIATHSRDLLIDQHVWERFHSVLVKLQKTGEVTDDQAATLFYNDYLASELCGFSDADKIDDDFVTEKIEKAGRIVESAHADLTKTKIELEESILASNAEMQQAQKISEQIEAARSYTKNIAKKWAGFSLHPIVLFVSTVFTFVTGSILTYFANSIGWTETMLALFTGGAGSLTIMNWKFCEWIKSVSYKNIYYLIHKELMKAFISKEVNESS